MSHFLRLIKDERGASMVEYSLLLGIITAATVVTIGAVGIKVGDAWDAVDGAWPAIAP